MQHDMQVACVCVCVCVRKMEEGKNERREKKVLLVHKRYEYLCLVAPLRIIGKRRRDELVAAYDMYLLTYLPR